MTTKPENVAYICSKCEIEKTIACFYSKGGVCRDCHNLRRRTKYQNDEEYRKKAIQTAIKVKQDKALVKQKIREEDFSSPIFYLITSLLLIVSLRIQFFF